MEFFIKVGMLILTVVGLLQKYTFKDILVLLFPITIVIEKHYILLLN